MTTATAAARAAPSLRRAGARLRSHRLSLLGAALCWGLAAVTMKHALAARLASPSMAATVAPFQQAARSARGVPSCSAASSSWAARARQIVCSPRSM
ncbi:hypothetical protein GCM10010412_099810 [Nonomuraea recticatena]|uniref:EamA family transporter n=1 Tax=Nonomuraea recticatena TaxID=46178 RepID=A0ABN3TF99_9ACTN